MINTSTLLVQIVQINGITVNESCNDGENLGLQHTNETEKEYPKYEMLYR